VSLTASAAMSAGVLAHGGEAKYVAASGIFSATWLLIAFPLAGAAILLLAGRRAKAWAHLLGCATVAASFVLGLLLFFTMLGREAAARSIDQHLFSWIPVDPFRVDAGLLLDPLSMTFVLLVTGVGGLIHIYSIGYMAHDPERRRFFGYLNLFVAAMLLLVLGNSFLALYVGWEGVGLASYLLIGFWSYKPTAATAAKKAFVVNRVGDVGLSLAIMLMFATMGTTSFAGVFTGADDLLKGTATAIGLLLLLGACGKSAQFPLQSWLLDAMEGPTPVSALIHAATMVTAGVYLIARANPIFDASPNARLAVTIVGAVTLVIGAIIGCAYDDIKKVLASSTMSQIGYMILAVGLGPGVYAIGILHLVTHGFFKANMFLGAGSVMHAMNDSVDMRRYGGLRTVMPTTFYTFAAGYLAIIGFPFFAGFFSKDKIIEAAFDKGGTSGVVLGLVALLGAGVTAYYMTRLMAMTFFGERRWDPDTHPHESPKSMTIPMIVLAIGSVISGGLLTLIGDGLQGFLTPSVGESVEVGAHTISPLVLTFLTLLVVAGGAAGGWYQFGRRAVPRTAPQNVPVVVTAARRSLYGDAFNETVFMRPGQYSARALVFFDNFGVDGAVRGLAALIGGSSGRMRRVQTGFVRSYALLMFGGAALVVLGLTVVRSV
jgi:NADH-quinone oxidoreductase subunit L